MNGLAEFGGWLGTTLPWLLGVLWSLAKSGLFWGSVGALVVGLFLTFHPVFLRFRLRASRAAQRGEAWVAHGFGLVRLGAVATRRTRLVVLEIGPWRKILQRSGTPRHPDGPPPHPGAPPTAPSDLPPFQPGPPPGAPAGTVSDHATPPPGPTDRPAPPTVSGGTRPPGPDRPPDTIAGDSRRLPPLAPAATRDRAASPSAAPSGPTAPKPATTAQTIKPPISTGQPLATDATPVSTSGPQEAGSAQPGPHTAAVQPPSTTRPGHSPMPSTSCPPSERAFDAESFDPMRGPPSQDGSGRPPRPPRPPLEAGLPPPGDDEPPPADGFLDRWRKIFRQARQRARRVYRQAGHRLRQARAVWRRASPILWRAWANSRGTITHRQTTGRLRIGFPEPPLTGVFTGLFYQAEGMFFPPRTRIDLVPVFPGAALSGRVETDLRLNPWRLVYVSLAFLVDREVWSIALDLWRWYRTPPNDSPFPSGTNSGNMNSQYSGGLKG